MRKVYITYINFINGLVEIRKRDREKIRRE